MSNLPAPRPRLDSIDAFRGFTILAMIFVIKAAGYPNLPLTFPHFGSAPVSTFKHADDNHEAGARREWAFHAGRRATPSDRAEADRGLATDPPSAVYHLAKVVEVVPAPVGAAAMAAAASGGRPDAPARFKIEVQSNDPRDTEPVILRLAKPPADLAGPLVVGEPLVAVGALDTPAGPKLMSAGTGVTFCDLVAPFFVFIVGLCIPLGKAGRAPGWWKAALRRTAMLVAAGVIYISLILKLSYWWGILQAIGVAYLVGAVLYQLPWRRRLAAFAALCVLHQGATFMVPGWVNLTHDDGRPSFTAEQFRLAVTPPAGGLTADGKPKFSPAQLKAREPDFLRPLQVHCTPWASLGYGLCTVLGCFLGEAVAGRRAATITKAALGLGAAGIGLGLLMHGPLHMPMHKGYVSVSYALFTSGVAALTFLGFYLVIDVAGFRRWAWFLSVFGSNALLAYFMQPVARIVLERLGLHDWFGGRGGWDGMLWAGLWTALLWICVLACNRRGLYWRL